MGPFPLLVSVPLLFIPNAAAALASLGPTLHVTWILKWLELAPCTAHSSQSGSRTAYSACPGQTLSYTAPTLGRLLHTACAPDSLGPVLQTVLSGVGLQTCQGGHHVWSSPAGAATMRSADFRLPGAATGSGMPIEGEGEGEGTEDLWAQTVPVPLIWPVGPHEFDFPDVSSTF